MEDELNQYQDLSLFSDFSQGKSCSIVLNGNSYNIHDKLGTGGEGACYVASNEARDAKVIKHLKASSVSSALDLESKLREKFRRVNQALSRNYEVDNLAGEVYVVGDFISGLNLEQEVEHRNKVYSSKEVLEILKDIVEYQLTPLHQHNLVHGDIKPNNIISNNEHYELVDFGTLREHLGDKTLTISNRGTLGYSSFNGKHVKQNDYFSLGRTALYLLTGEHPDFAGNKKLNKIIDDGMLQKAALGKDFRNLLQKMLGHGQEYNSPEEILSDLQDVNTDLAVVEFEKDLAFHRKFGHKYAGTIQHRNRLTEEDKINLDKMLRECGFMHEPFGGRLEKIYIRPHLDSELTDIFVIKDGNNKDFFDFHTSWGMSHFTDEYEIDFDKERAKFGLPIGITAGLGYGVYETAMQIMAGTDPTIWKFFSIIVKTGSIVGGISFLGLGLGASCYNIAHGLFTKNALADQISAIKGRMLSDSECLEKVFELPKGIERKLLSD